MSTTLTINPITMNVGWDSESTTTFGTNTVQASRFLYSKTLGNGTGASAANKMFATTYTISASSTQQVDLAGVLTDFYGNTVTFTKIKVLYIELTTTTSASTIKVGGGTDGAGTNAFINWVAAAADLVRIRNGGCLMLACTDATGYAVTAATGDILALVNEDVSNAATVNIFLAGE